MLSEAELYSHLSQDHVREATASLDQVRHLVPAAPGEVVLDIGAGSGDVTVRVVLPSLHPHFSLLVGSDVSPSMVAFAKKRWVDERLKWIRMDAQDSDLSTALNALPVKKFDKIFSFFALQWVGNRRQVARNVSSLLTANGTALLVLVVRSGIYPAWDHMASSSKWASYLSNIKVPLNEYQYMEEPDVDLIDKLKKEGLEILYSKIEAHYNAFSSHTDTNEQKILKLKAVDPLVGFIPEQKQQEYMEDLLAHVKSNVSPKGAVDYTSLTIVCRKKE